MTPNILLLHPPKITYSPTISCVPDLGHQFKLTRLEYYISGISITHDGGMETKVSDTYILAKANQTNSVLLGNLDVTNIESINFSIGVDQPPNLRGNQV